MFAIKKLVHPIRLSNLLTSRASYCLVKKTVEANPFFDKYKQKIESLKTNDPDTFQKKHEAHFNPSPKPKIKPPSSQTTTKPKQMSLESIVDLDKMRELHPVNIEELWKDYHAAKEATIYGTIPANNWDMMKSRASMCPMFVYLLPRQDGWEFFLAVSQFNQIHFTSLLSWQTHKENAPAILALSHFDELANDKELVLFNGWFDDRALTRGEAQLLVHQVQRYYGLLAGDRFNYVKLFNQSPAVFDYQILIKEFKEFTKTES